MRVQHLNTHTAGGAARAALRLHQSLRQAEVDSHFLTAEGKGDPDQAIARLQADHRRLNLFERLRRSYLKKQRKRIRKAGGTSFTSFPWSDFRPRDFSQVPVPAIWHLHWVSNFLDWPTMLPWLAETAPIVWTLHDLNPLLGLWHHAPDESEQSRNALAWDRYVRRTKQKVLSHVPAERLRFVVTSQWVKAQFLASEAAKRFECTVVPLGLDTSRFSPIIHERAREALGIEGNRLVLGFIADDLPDPQKGFAFLATAVRQLPFRNRVTILAVGNGSLCFDDLDVRVLGRIQDDLLLRLFYSALDLLLCPSTREAFGQTVFESMACGTPVVAFDTGGIPDMVRPGETGWLAPTGDTAALATRIEEALSDRDHLARIGQRCREVAVEEYDLSVQARNILGVYRTVLDS